MTAFTLFGLVATAQAMEPLAPVQQGAFTCQPAAGGLHRVSTGEVGGCCSPNSHCVDLLSTTVLEHGSHADRT